MIQLFVIVSVLFIVWLPLIIRYSNESLIKIVLIIIFAYCSGSLIGTFPIKPKNLHVWFAIYKDEVIGTANINRQNNYSIL